MTTKFLKDLNTEEKHGFFHGTCPLCGGTIKIGTVRKRVTLVDGLPVEVNNEITILFECDKCGLIIPINYEKTELLEWVSEI